MQLSGIRPEDTGQPFIIYANELGIVISTAKLFSKSQNCALTYFEIKDIDLAEDKSNLKIILKDNNVIQFQHKYEHTESISLVKFVNDYRKKNSR